MQFVDDLPTFIEDARAQTADWLTQYRERVPEDVQEEIDGYVSDAGAVLADRVAGMAQRSVDLLTSTIGIVFGFVIVPFWMFYALRDRHNVARNFMNAVPAPARDDVSNLLAIADWVLLRYVRAQLFLGVVVGTAVGVGLTLLDVPLSLALGVIAGITELIPIIGPWIGAVPGMVLTAGTGDTELLLKVGLLYLAVQQVENLLLVPRVQGHAVELHRDHHPLAGRRRRGLRVRRAGGDRAAHRDPARAVLVRRSAAQRDGRRAGARTEPRGQRAPAVAIAAGASAPQW